MKNSTILIIDDEPQIRRLVRNALSGEGVMVSEAGTGGEGLDRAASGRPSLVILDLGLPDMSGMSVCVDLRKWTTVPIIVLSARHSDIDKVALLDAGADDYVSKPFSTAELLARVRAQIRRAAIAGLPAPEGYEIGGLRIDPARRIVTRNGADVHLTPTEWDLLRAFLRHAGRTLTHRQIYKEVWRAPAGDAQSYLRVHVANLRRKIEPDPLRPELILTEPGVGYRFRATDPDG